MKKLLLLSFLIAALFSCKNSVPPKDVAKEFIEAAYAGDAAKASSLATEKTKASITSLAPKTPGMSADESFSLTTLTEAINGNTAEVKNDLIRVSLEKEGEGWLVAATPDLVTSISNRQADLLALKSGWEGLHKEYESRLELAKNYVTYKKGQGALSPQMEALEEMTNTLSVKTVWDKEKILLYVQRQNQLADMIDKALEPSYTAGSDMSMNYILQLSQANDRIKTAQAEYQALAEKTPSAAYPALTMK
jgi:hypothetical protein